MKTIILATFLFLSFGANAQQIHGQTRTFIINDLRYCEILLNEPLYIVFKCSEDTYAFFFDDDGLSSRTLTKLSAKDCEELKQVVISEGGALMSTRLVSAPMGEKLTTTRSYLLRGVVYEFSEGDTEGNNPGKYGTMATRRYTGKD
jgi:hypothetical protein